MLREQHFFHHKYKPEMLNYANKQLFKGIYSPNEFPTDKLQGVDNRKEPAAEFIRDYFSENIEVEGEPTKGMNNIRQYVK